MMNSNNKKQKVSGPDALEEQDGGGPATAVSAASEALEPHHLSEEEIEQLKEQAAKADEHWQQMLRVAADFENFKKRAARERQEVSKYANESLLQKLIPVLDNLDMALAAASNAKGNTLQQLQAGITMIHQQLRNVLAEAGLEEVDATKKTFDPNWHEAVAQKETAEVPEGQVLQQLRKGYKLRDRLLRPASEVVANKPAG